MFIHKLISAIKLSSELQFVLMILTTPPHQSLPERKNKQRLTNKNKTKTNTTLPSWIMYLRENINKKCLTRHYK